MNSHRRHKAQTIVETVVGIIFLIPIVLFMLDVAVLVLGNTANDNLAKSAARAAASAVDPGTGVGTPARGVAAVQNVVNNFAANANGIIPAAQLALVEYNGANALGPTSTPPGGLPPSAGAGQVAVMIRMDIQPPVPMPGVARTTFYARAVEPIVALPP